MKKLIIILGLLFLLTSCYSNNKELEKKEFIFQKNKECVEINIKEQLNDKDGLYKIKESFYSLNENSCILLIESQTNRTYLYDSLKMKWLISQDTICNSENPIHKEICYEEQKLFKEQLNELKN